MLLQKVARPVSEITERRCFGPVKPRTHPAAQKNAGSQINTLYFNGLNVAHELERQAGASQEATVFVEPSKVSGSPWKPRAGPRENAVVSAPAGRRGLGVKVGEDRPQTTASACRPHRAATPFAPKRRQISRHADPTHAPRTTSRRLPSPAGEERRHSPRPIRAPHARSQPCQAAARPPAVARTASPRPPP